MLNYKNGPPKYLCLYFYTMNIVYAIEYHPYRPHIRVPWWKRCSKCILGVPLSELPHQQIFDRGDHFHLLQRRAARLATIVEPWWTVSDYFILQHRHRGCCLFVGGSSPEISKFLSELPRFTLPSLFAPNATYWLILFLLPLFQNELSVLEFIHAIVETFDRYFESVVSCQISWHSPFRYEP